MTDLGISGLRLIDVSDGEPRDSVRALGDPCRAPGDPGGSEAADSGSAPAAVLP